MLVEMQLSFGRSTPTCRRCRTVLVGAGLRPFALRKRSVGVSSGNAQYERGLLPVATKRVACAAASGSPTEPSGLGAILQQDAEWLLTCEPFQKTDIQCTSALLDRALPRAVKPGEVLTAQGMVPEVSPPARGFGATAQGLSLATRATPRLPPTTMIACRAAL